MREIKNLAIKSYLLSKPESREDYPFGADIAVFKVKNKMFATLSERQGSWQMNLKCDPEEALMLRDVFHFVLPGYHMNKAHWNTVVLDGLLDEPIDEPHVENVPMGEVERMIDNSYALVIKGMTKAQRRSLETLYNTAELYGRSTASL